MGRVGREADAMKKRSQEVSDFSARRTSVSVKFINDKTGLVTGTAVDHEKVGRKPCGICLPGGDA